MTGKPWIYPAIATIGPATVTTDRIEPCCPGGFMCPEFRSDLQIDGRSINVKFGATEPEAQANHAALLDIVRIASVRLITDLVTHDEATTTCE